MFYNSRCVKMNGVFISLKIDCKEDFQQGARGLSPLSLCRVWPWPARPLLNTLLNYFSSVTPSDPFTAQVCSKDSPTELAPHLLLRHASETYLPLDKYRL